MEYNIAVVKGDGIGPEIVTEAMQVLDKVGERFGHTFHYQEVLAGGCSIDANGIPLTEETIEICKTRTPCCSARSAALSGTKYPRKTPGESAARPAFGARPVRQPASGADAQGAVRRVSDQARDHRRRL